MTDNDQPLERARLYLPKEVRVSKCELVGGAADGVASIALHFSDDIRIGLPVFDAITIAQSIIACATYILKDQLHGEEDLQIDDE